MIEILMFLFSFSSLAEKEDCKSLRTGIFQTKTEIENSDAIITTIERTGDIQYERSEQLGVEYKFKVDWISDCSYRLIWLETIKDENNFGYPSNLILTIEITEMKSDYYMQTASSNLFEGSIEGKVEIIK